MVRPPHTSQPRSSSAPAPVGTASCACLGSPCNFIYVPHFAEAAAKAYHKLASQGLGVEPQPLIFHPYAPMQTTSNARDVPNHIYYMMDTPPGPKPALGEKRKR